MTHTRGLLDSSDGPLVRSASTAATEVIRKAILDGRLKPGERLKEGSLASELGISRTPLREALRVLQAEGLIMVLPNRGAVVRSYSLEELEEIYELRAVLEAYAARRAAKRASVEQIRELKDSCTRFTELHANNDVTNLVKENFLFHTAISEAAGSERLIDLVRKTIELPLFYRSFHWYSEEQRALSERRHRQIAEAVDARDPERAGASMEKHVLEALNFLKTQMRSELEPDPAVAAPILSE